MEKRQIDMAMTMTIYDLTERFPESIELLVEVGFENMGDKTQRQTLGKAITLEKTLRLKSIDLESFLEELERRLEGDKTTDDEVVSIAGVLPCPVKHPLMDMFEKWMIQNRDTWDFKLKHELKAASIGVDWIHHILKDGSMDSVPDLFISAGFDLFFDKELFGKYRDKGYFEDLTGIKPYNRDLENETISLRDPKGHYSMLAIVPAVFMVNTDELDGRDIPRSWKELLTENFYRRVSLPIKDFDLFNSILLSIYKEMGEEGVEKLGRIMKSNMHPSEMVKSHKKKSGVPIVTIMPYFFTSMVKESDPLKAVWPEDGAIVSPIFMLSKSESSEKLKPIVDFFSSREVGEVLAHNGRFPSVNPDVDNRLSEEKRFMWVGWDFINSNDIGKILKKCETIFENASKELI